MSKKILLKDVVIKAGTVFDTTPNKTTRDSTHYDCLVGLTDNTCGVFTYCVDPDFEDEMSKWFSDEATYINENGIWRKPIDSDKNGCIVLARSQYRLSPFHAVYEGNENSGFWCLSECRHIAVAVDEVFEQSEY